MKGWKCNGGGGDGGDGGGGDGGGLFTKSNGDPCVAETADILKSWWNTSPFSMPQPTIQAFVSLLRIIPSEVIMPHFRFSSYLRVRFFS